MFIKKSLYLILICIALYSLIIINYHVPIKDYILQIYNVDLYTTTALIIIRTSRYSTNLNNIDTYTAIHIIILIQQYLFYFYMLCEICFKLFSK